VEVYEQISIIEGIKCDEPLDIVKSLPEFDGRQEQYISWRQSATVAYEIFKPFLGSSKHYQAVAIIRHKIRGSADAVLASFNTVLNFMRLGDMPLAKYYDEVEKKLTLLTNKTLMSHDTAAATVLNEKYRSDALHTFISGLKNSLKMAVFPAKPKDLPTALALAQEAQSSHERSVFAATFARHADEKSGKPPNKNTNWRQNQNFKPQNFNHENASYRQRNFSQKNPGQSVPEPMEVDPSSRTRQTTNSYKGYSTPM